MPMRHLLSSTIFGLALWANPASAVTWTLGGEVGGSFGPSPHGPGPALGVELAPDLDLLDGRLLPTLGLDLGAPGGRGEIDIPGLDGTGTWHLRTAWLAPELGARLALAARDEPILPELALSGGLCLARTTSWTEANGSRGPTAVDGAAAPCLTAAGSLLSARPTRELGATLGATLMPLQSPLMDGGLRVFPTLRFVYRWRKA